MLRRILVPLDGSERAERGLAMAARLARGSGSELLLVRIVSVPPFRFAPFGEPAQIALALIATAREGAEEYLNRLRKSPMLADIAVETRAIEGHVTADILDIARSEQCDLIVITTHGYTGFNSWRLGRVAEQTARHAPAPVLIMPVRDARSASYSEAEKSVRLLVPLDGSQLAEAAIPSALDLARALAAPQQTTIHLVQVVDFFTAMMRDAEHEKNATAGEPGAEEHALEEARRYLDTTAETIRHEHPGVTVTTSATLASDIAKMICEIADGQPRYDFVAMATHGRGGVQRWALGSITERVLHAMHLPLLIARSPAAIEHDRVVAEAVAEAQLHR